MHKILSLTLPSTLVASALAVACANGNVADAAQEAEAAPGEPMAATVVAPVAAPSDLEKAFSQAAEKIRPSVVSITTVRKMKGPQMGPMGDPLLERFFGRPIPRGGGEQHGLGSGVVIDTDGHVLTNSHVVAEADELTVQMHDDTEYAATVVGVDPKTDVAVIKLEEGAEKLVPATFADSRELSVGQWVLAVGSPFGLRQTVSAGIVSAVGRGNVGITDYEAFIQTDAAINPGNSGGPLIDLGGNVVGLNTAIASRSGGSNGIGFAIPIEMVRHVADQLVKEGKVTRGWLGILIGKLTPELARSFGHDGDGVLVQDVVEEGPALAAGVQSGDIIVELDGRAVDDVGAFRNEIAAHAPGDRVKLAVIRDGKKKRLTVELGELPGEEGTARPTAKAQEELGMMLRDPEPAAMERFGLEKGASGALVVAVQPGSVAAKAGLRVGDLIEKVDGKAVKSASAARKKLQKADLEQGIRLRVRRGKYGHFVILRD